MDIRLLPNEILGIIADNVMSEVDLFHLAQTNRLFSQISIPRLYLLNDRRTCYGIKYLASCRGRLDILRRAAQSGVFIGDYDLASAAARSGHTKVLDFIATSRGTPFDADALAGLVKEACSARTADFGMLSHLFNEYNASLDPRELSLCLMNAVAQNNIKCVQLLLDKGADVSTEIWQEPPLHMAVRNGDSDLANILLEHGANVHSRGNGDATLLHRAVGCEHFGTCIHVDVLKVLLNHGADPSATSRGLTPLELATSKKKIAAACVLIRETTTHGASLETLFAALDHDDATLELVQLHLEAGVAGAELLNTQDHIGRTVLFVAARDGKLDMVEEFLAHGVDTRIADDFGTTPIFAAARNGHVDVVRRLLDIDPGLIETTDEVYGSHSLLYWAQRSSNSSLVKFLRRAIKLAGLENPEDAKGQSVARKKASGWCWKKSCNVCARRLGSGISEQFGLEMCYECLCHINDRAECGATRSWILSEWVRGVYRNSPQRI